MRIKPNVKVISGPAILTPLVDLFFLLLVFFMLSSSLVFWPGTKVETKVHLPRSRVRSMNAADKLVLTITHSGLLFFNDKHVGWDDLERELRELVRRSKLAATKRNAWATEEEQKSVRSPLVVVRADRSIDYAKIVEVMSLAQSLGLGVYLVTAPMPEADPLNGGDPRRLGEEL